MARFTDEELMRKVQEGFIVESEADMTETYKKALINQLTVQGDTELMSAPAYWMAAKDAPSANTMVSATAIIQDELGHANIAYRLLQDLGVDTDELLYDRPPNRFKNPFGFDQPLANWAELVTAKSSLSRGFRRWRTLMAKRASSMAWGTRSTSAAATGMIRLCRGLRSLR